MRSRVIRIISGGDFDAPEGNGNACDPAVSEGANCGGSGVKPVSPEHKKELDDLEEKIDNSIKTYQKNVDDGNISQEEADVFIKSINEYKNDLVEQINEKYGIPYVTEEVNSNNKYKTKEEVINKFSELGIKSEDISIDKFVEDNGGMNTPNEIISTIEKTYNDYPELKGKIKGFAVLDSNKKSPYAAFDGTRNVLSYNGLMSQSGINKRAKGNYDKHFAIDKPSVKYVVDHELGHMIANDLIGIKGSRFIINDTKLNSIYTEFTNNTKKDKNYAANNLSTYGTVSAHEFVAECWGEYRNSSNPRPIASKVGKLLENYIKTGKT